MNLSAQLDTNNQKFEDKKFQPMTIQKKLKNQKLPIFAKRSESVPAAGDQLSAAQNGAGQSNQMSNASLPPPIAQMNNIGPPGTNPNYIPGYMVPEQ